MQISLFAINALTPYIFGKDGVAKNRTSKQLVDLFNKFGCRDVLIDWKFHTQFSSNLHNQILLYETTCVIHFLCACYSS